MSSPVLSSAAGPPPPPPVGSRRVRALSILAVCADLSAGVADVTAELSQEHLCCLPAALDPDH